MALLGALCIWLNSLGFTNRSLRAQVSQLLGVPPEVYTRNHMSYDLARLRRKGLIERRPGTNTYDLTADGQRVALFYTKGPRPDPRPPSSPPTDNQPHPGSAEHSPPSTTASTTDSNTPQSRKQPETQDDCQTLMDLES